MLNFVNDTESEVRLDYLKQFCMTDNLRGKITALVIGATFRSRSEDTACLFIFQSVECADLTRRPFCFLFCFTFMYMTCLSQF